MKIVYTYSVTGSDITNPDDLSRAYTLVRSDWQVPERERGYGYIDRLYASARAMAKNEFTREDIGVVVDYVRDRVADIQSQAPGLDLREGRKSLLLSLADTAKNLVDQFLIDFETDLNG
jgi:hypothetical protein